MSPFSVAPVIVLAVALVAANGAVRFNSFCWFTRPSPD
jgi:hypothetical protein